MMYLPNRSMLARANKNLAERLEAGLRGSASASGGALPNGTACRASVNHNVSLSVNQMGV